MSMELRKGKCWLYDTLILSFEPMSQVHRVLKIKSTLGMNDSVSSRRILVYKTNHPLLPVAMPLALKTVQASEGSPPPYLPLWGISASSSLHRTFYIRNQTAFSSQFAALWLEGSLLENYTEINYDLKPWPEIHFLIHLLVNRLL